MGAGGGGGVEPNLQMLFFDNFWKKNKLETQDFA